MSELDMQKNIHWVGKKKKKEVCELKYKTLNNIKESTTSSNSIVVIIPTVPYSSSEDISVWTIWTTRALVKIQVSPSESIIPCLPLHKTTKDEPDTKLQIHGMRLTILFSCMYNQHSWYLPSQTFLDFICNCWAYLLQSCLSCWKMHYHLLTQ